MALLKVRNLRTFYFVHRGTVRAVDDISFSLDRGETLGLAGESGCGKSTSALSIIRLVPPPGRIVEGEILFNGENIVEKREEEMKKIRWTRISMVFQGAMSAFDPVYTIGDQITEAIVYHEKIDKKEAEERVEGLLDMVGIDVTRRRDYPHEFSGGMLQRALLAMALACNPDILIADEPGTALDVVVQAKLLNDLERLQRKMNLSIILITHDLALIAGLAQKVAIMYAGKIVEQSDSKRFFEYPIHPYSGLLLNAFPNVHGPRTPLADITGTPPNLINPPPGCRFHPRCPIAKDICSREEPPLKEVMSGCEVACHFAEEIAHEELTILAR